MAQLLFPLYASSQCQEMKANHRQHTPSLSFHDFHSMTYQCTIYHQGLAQIINYILLCYCKTNFSKNDD